MKANSGKLNQNPRKVQPRSPDWLGEMQIERDITVVCPGCSCAIKHRVSFLQRLAAWGQHHLNIKLSDPGQFQEQAPAPARSPTCADSAPRETHREVKPPGRKQPDLVDRAEAISRDVEEFNDEIPF